MHRNTSRMFIFQIRRIEIKMSKRLFLSITLVVCSGVFESSQWRVVFSEMLLDKIFTDFRNPGGILHSHESAFTI